LIENFGNLFICEFLLVQSAVAVFVEIQLIEVGSNDTAASKAEDQALVNHDQ